ncbi:rhodanese-like domain-containing protein [Haladaptatus sp. DJG-WS-42]|uniref:MBL fold metallo-hydrolase n=1 Tax=Haladaptatus sp. DJG-WS-42 TaxID=3120516 RepID=UPI0030CEECD4
MVSRITADDLRRLVDDDVSFALIDTRPPDNFAAWHVEGAQNFPYKPGDPVTKDEIFDELGVTTDDRIVTICAKGISSDRFADALSALGYANVSLVEGGMKAWSAVYDTVTIPTDSDKVTVIQVQRRAKGCLSYLIIARHTGTAAVIDATRHTAEFVSLAERHGVEITDVFDTHVHADHLSGGRALADAVGATYHLGERATDRGVTYDYDALGRNDVVTVGDVAIKAVAVPGHTSEMVNYLVDDVAVCTGDTLFTNSVGRTELQFGDADAADGARLLYQSLHGTLLAEPDDVLVLPGHFTISADGSSPNATPGNPIYTDIHTVRTDLSLLTLPEAEFVDRITATLPEKPPNYETVIAINTGMRAISDDQEATELELGPNNCAAEETA